MARIVRLRALCEECIEENDEEGYSRFAVELQECIKLHVAQTESAVQNLDHVFVAWVGKPN